MKHSPIARGRTADVYAWENGQVLKLFHEWMAGETVAWERMVSRLVQETGLPAPAVGKIVEVEGRQGLLYERVVGPTMLAVFESRPWTLWAMARRLAELQSAVHAVAGMRELPSQRERLAAAVDGATQLDVALRRRLLQTLASLPAGEQLCHGDFHPDNVIVARRGAVIIDWLDATRGNPAGDVARTSVLALGEAQKRETSWVGQMLLRLFHGAYLRQMARLQPRVVKEAGAWRPIVAAARMREGIGELQEWLAGVADGVGV